MEKTLSQLKKGEFFKFLGFKKIYIYKGKDRKFGFEYVDSDDISGFHYTKTDRKVITDFEF